MEPIRSRLERPRGSQAARPRAPPSLSHCAADAGTGPRSAQAPQLTTAAGHKVTGTMAIVREGGGRPGRWQAPAGRWLAPARMQLFP